MKAIRPSRLLLSRFLIGAVLFVNIQAAIAFLINPDVYAPWYELSGSVGKATVKGFGVLFLMWNVPYLIAFIHPRKHRMSLYEALAMQCIGLLGELFIWFDLPLTNLLLRRSIMRFVLFDGVGLIILILAFMISQNIKDEAN
jgi:hypothetical protein